MNRKETTERRAQFKVSEATVRRILNEWAPIGVGTPEDEYDCLVHRILSVLHGHGSILDVQAALQNELSGHFGLSGVPAEEINRATAKIWSWWLEQKAK